jgi:hypothetical protein
MSSLVLSRSEGPPAFLRGGCPDPERREGSASQMRGGSYAACVAQDLGPPTQMRGGSFASLRTWATGVVVMLVTQIANACPVCFGGPNSLGKGTDAAIWFLLSIVGFVQLGIVALFFSFWRRAKEMRRRRDSFHLLEGGMR